MAFAMSDVLTGLSTFKSMLEIAKGLKDMTDASARNAVAIELQEKILAAHATQTELVETATTLKSRVAELEAWDADKNRYELKEIQTGVTAYTLKEGMEDGEIPHYLCPNCYTDKTKKLLQREVRNPGMVKMLVCHHCGLELIQHGMRQPEHGKAFRGRR
jgi:hypothetical protein